MRYKAELARGDLEMEQVKENGGLKGELEIGTSMEFDGKAYWLRKPDGTKDGPYCPNCYKTRSKTVQMQKETPSKVRTYHCPDCKLQVVLKIL